MRGQERIFTRNFIYIFFATFAFFAGFVFFFPVLPIFIDELGGTPALIGALIGGSSMVSICLRPFSGRLIDEQGRRRYLTIGALLLTTSSFSYELVTDTVFLWPVRLAAGAGVSLFFTASLAFVGDITPNSKRGQAMGYWGTANNLALALGPLLATALLKASFLHSFEHDLRNWYPGNGSSVAGDDLNFATCFLVAGIIGLVCVFLSRQLTENYIPVKQPKQTAVEMIKGTINRKAMLPGTLNLLMVLNFVSLNIFVPVYAEEIGVANVGLSFYTVFAVFIVVSRLFSGHLLDHFPRAYSIVPAFVVMSGATILIGLVQEPWVLPIGAALVGLGAGFVQPGLQALLLDKVEGERLGSASATFALGLDIGRFGGGFVMGLILELSGFRVMYLAAGMAGLTAAMILSVATIRDAKDLAGSPDVTP